MPAKIEIFVSRYHSGRNSLVRPLADEYIISTEDFSNHHGEFAGR
jgi:hypothetical protein